MDRNFKVNCVEFFCHSKDSSDSLEEEKKVEKLIKLLIIHVIHERNKVDMFRKWKKRTHSFIPQYFVKSLLAMAELLQRQREKPSGEQWECI